MKINDIINEGITHIEELPVDDFIKSIRNLNMYEITEKIDGANIQFGIDDNKKFFTSREGKGGDRYYNVDDWGDKFWQTGFKSAHLALEPIAHKILKPGETVEAEILFGELPNTVPYSGEQNQIILLRPIEGNPNIEKISNQLEEYTTSVTLDRVPYTDDGTTIKYQPEEHTWVISKTPNIPNDIITKDEAKNEINRRVDKLEQYLKQEITIGNIKMLVPELLSIKLNQQPPNIDKSIWKTVKEEVKAKREEVLEHIRGLQLEVKDTLLNLLVRQIRSKFGPELDAGGWIEGVVLRHKETGEQVKIVDKSVFTTLNKFYHEIISKITDHRVADSIKNTLTRGMAEVIGHPTLGSTSAKRYLQKHGSNPDEILNKLGKEINVEQTKSTWLRLIDQASINLDKLLKEYKSSDRTININLGATAKKFTHTGPAAKKTMQTFAEFKRFLDSAKTNIHSAKTGAELLNIFIGDKLKSTTSESLILEGGHAVPNTGAITKEEISPTIQKFSTIINIPAIMLKSNMLGSAGKVDVSGDIDIALDSNTYNAEDLKEKLASALGVDNVKYMKGFGIVSSSFPIENYNESFETDKLRTGRVQIDLMFGKPDWLKFSFFSAGDKSKYKGLFRTIMLVATANSLGQAVLNKNGEIIGKLGPAMLMNLGIQIQAKKRKIGRKGELLKGDEKVSLEDFKTAFPEADIDRYGKKFLIDKPDEVAQFLFGDIKPNIKASDLGTFENVIALIKQKPKEQQKFIKEKATERLKDAGFEFPEGLL